MCQTLIRPNLYFHSLSLIPFTIHLSKIKLSESEVSREAPPSVNSLSINQNNEKDGDWDESALASKAAKPAPSATNGPAEIKDMSAFGAKASEQDDIAQRMRTEEIKQKLAAAKDGMKKEEQRLKEEQAAKEAKKQEQSQTSNRFGSAAAAVGGGVGGKWVPSHMRGRSTPAAGPGPRFGAAVSAASGSGFQKKVDTNDEELFPDLATADKLIQEEEEKKAANAAAASAANRAKAATSKPRWGIRAEKEKEEKKTVEKEEPKPEEVKVDATAPASAATASAPTPIIKKKKKKKKDLSTFITS